MTDGPDIVKELVGPHQSLNLVREAIEDLKTELDKCPRAEDPLTSVIYRTWDRRTMMKLGAAFGHLRHAQACGHITPEVYQKLYLEIMGITTRAAARVDMLGVR
jgi:hypothetical protein